MVERWSNPFRPAARVTIVAGKGGVGKTTVSATLAYLAAASGSRVLIVEMEDTSGLAALFDSATELSYDETELLPAGAAGPGAGWVKARTLTPDDALLEYLEERGMRRISRRLTSTGTLDVVATAIPGIKDILVLGKVKQIEVQAATGASVDAPDLIVVDAPAAGHAITFLGSAFGLLEAAVTGPIRAQAVDVIEMLSDPARCQVVLVTLPEETPVNEAADTAFQLEDRAGVKLGPIVVNGVWPVLDLSPLPEVSTSWPQAPSPQTLLSEEERGRVEAAARFRLARQAQQSEQLERLSQILPLEQVPLPYIFSTSLGLADIKVLASAMGR